MGATILCPHGGQAQIITTNVRVKVGGQPAALMNDTYTVAGCPFQVPTPAGPKPQPCIKVQWLVPAVRVKVTGKPVIIKSSTGLCLSPEQIPQGPPNIVMTQMRVKGI